MLRGVGLCENNEKSTNKDHNIMWCGWKQHLESVSLVFFDWNCTKCFEDAVFVEVEWIIYYKVNQSTHTN
jgi:hypothetical protein